MAIISTFTVPPVSPVTSSFIQGAHYSKEGTTFCVWAPSASTLDLYLCEQARVISMDRLEHGYYAVTVPDLRPGTAYLYQIEGTLQRPDPASYHQPEGVHAASALVDHTFSWTDADWESPDLYRQVLYELHVGTFSAEGTFEGIIPRLPYLKDLGVTTIELMPIGAFPGDRNWGYDGVYMYAPHHAYGGVTGLKKLVNACHNEGLSVFLDVVYNHFGPEGNYLPNYGPYLTNAYHSPWGDSVNLDGPESGPVRAYFIHNALHWLEYYHIDGLRLDAAHTLYDSSAHPFLSELSDSVQSWASRSGKRVHLIAEHDQNDRRVVLPTSKNGFGQDAVWMDDFHHALHVACTGEKQGYYEDYQDFALLPKILQEGFGYSGQHAPSRKRKHGSPSHDLPPQCFVVSTQTHDQVGNRLRGERLSHLTDLAYTKLAACCLLSSPYVPMLFMGEEYGEKAPFLYFTSHSDPALIASINKGRAKEFAEWSNLHAPVDAQDADSCQVCKLDHSLHERPPHAELFSLYKALLRIRKNHIERVSCQHATRHVLHTKGARALCVQYTQEQNILLVAMNFDPSNDQTIQIANLSSEQWEMLLDSNAPPWRSQPNDQEARLTHYQQYTQVTLGPKSFTLYYLSI